MATLKKKKLDARPAKHLSVIPVIRFTKSDLKKMERDLRKRLRRFKEDMEALETAGRVTQKMLNELEFTI